jgi:hypothetical protein
MPGLRQTALKTRDVVRLLESPFLVTGLFLHRFLDSQFNWLI